MHDSRGYNKIDNKIKCAGKHVKTLVNFLKLKTKDEEMEAKKQEVDYTLGNLKEDTDIKMEGMGEGMGERTVEGMGEEMGERMVVEARGEADEKSGEMETNK